MQKRSVNTEGVNEYQGALLQSQALESCLVTSLEGNECQRLCASEDPLDFSGVRSSVRMEIYTGTIVAELRIFILSCLVLLSHILFCLFSLLHGESPGYRLILMSKQLFSNSFSKFYNLS